MLVVTLRLSLKSVHMGPSYNSTRLVQHWEIPAVGFHSENYCEDMEERCEELEERCEDIEERCDDLEESCEDLQELFENMEERSEDLEKHCEDMEEHFEDLEAIVTALVQTRCDRPQKILDKRRMRLTERLVHFALHQPDSKRLHMFFFH